MINVALPKGRLGEKVYKMFEEAGYGCPDIFEGRKLDVPLQPGDTVYIPKDGLSVWNVYISKLMPTGAFINMLVTPFFWYNSFRIFDNKKI